MAQYYCYLLNAQGHIKAREIVDGLDDASAIKKARGYMTAHPSTPAVELWLEGVFVGRLSQGPA